MRLREQNVCAAAREVAPTARASETADGVSKATVTASEDAVCSASRARESTSRVREALRAVRATSATRTRRVTEAIVSAASLPLVATATSTAPAPTPAPDLVPQTSTSPARSRSTPGPGGPGTWTSWRGVSSACSRTKPVPRLGGSVGGGLLCPQSPISPCLADLSVNPAWIQMTTAAWQHQQSLALTMGLVVSLRKANDASPTLLCSPEPHAYLGHLRNQECSGHHGTGL